MSLERSATYSQDPPSACSPCHCFWKVSFHTAQLHFQNHVFQSMMKTAAASPTNHFPAGLFSFCAEHRSDPRSNRPRPFQSQPLCFSPPAQFTRTFWNSFGLFKNVISDDHRQQLGNRTCSLMQPCLLC